MRAAAQLCSAPQADSWALPAGTRCAARARRRRTLGCGLPPHGPSHGASSTHALRRWSGSIHSFINFPSRRPIDTIQQKGEGAAGQPYPKNPPAAGLWAPAAAHCAGGGSLSGAELDRLLALLRELEGRWVAEGACLGPPARVGEPTRVSFLGLSALLPQLGTTHCLLDGPSARAAAPALGCAVLCRGGSGGAPGPP